MIQNNKSSEIPIKVIKKSSHLIKALFYKQIISLNLWHVEHSLDVL